MDCLLIHVPNLQRLNEREIIIPASGLFSLADTLETNGISTRILHHGLKLLFEDGYDLAALLTSQKPHVVGLSLHWHFQLNSVLEIARQVKSILPGAPIVVGGYTASCFDEDLLRQHPEIDYVIRGDGEIPLLKFVQGFRSGNLVPASIPNLTWKEAGAIRRNPITYLNTLENTSSICHTRLELFPDHDLFLHKDLEFDRNSDLHNCFYYHFAKGCPAACSTCGGGCLAQKRLFNRKGFFFYDPEKVIRDLKKLRDFGVDALRVCCDPDPAGSWYPELFDRIRRTGLRFRMVFESWGLPGDSFIDSFAQTFSPDSMIVLSPDVGSEAVRKRNKSFYFTNADLMTCLDKILKAGIRPHLYFSYGLPGERESDLETTHALMLRVMDRGAVCSVSPMFLDPFSPVFMDPDRFDVKLRCRTLEDFIQIHADDSIRLGYRTADLSEQQILLSNEFLIESANAGKQNRRSDPVPSSRNRESRRLDWTNDLREIKRRIDRDHQADKTRSQLRLLHSLILAFRPYLQDGKKLRNDFAFAGMANLKRNRIAMRWQRGAEDFSLIFSTHDSGQHTFIQENDISVSLDSEPGDLSRLAYFQAAVTEIRECLSAIASH